MPLQAHHAVVATKACFAASMILQVLYSHDMRLASRARVLHHDRGTLCALVATVSHEGWPTGVRLPKYKCFSNTGKLSERAVTLVREYAASHRHTFALLAVVGATDRVVPTGIILVCMCFSTLLLDSLLNWLGW